MELFEIIKSTLSIFSFTAILFITISYTIFKIRDRSRVKPYLKVNAQEPLRVIMNDQKSVNMNMEYNFEEEEQFDNVVLVKLPVQNKFTIINGNVTVGKLNKAGYKKENSKQTLNSSKESNNNIYDLISNRDEKVHNLKLVAR
jgi:hypothetical protein